MGVDGIVDFPNYPMIFVTGISGSGKTFLAKNIAYIWSIPYINFDKEWDYNDYNYSTQAKEILTSLPPSFVIDAIPFCSHPDTIYSEFNLFCERHSNEILIIITTCLNIKTWLKRLEEKNPEADRQELIERFIRFHTCVLPLIPKENIIYYDTFSNKRIMASNIHAYIN